MDFILRGKRRKKCSFLLFGPSIYLSSKSTQWKVPSGDPVSLFLGDVHPKAQTAFGILIRVESHRNWISNKSLASLLVVTQSIKHLLYSSSSRASLPLLPFLCRHSGSHSNSWSVGLWLKCLSLLFYRGRKKTTMLFVSCGKVETKNGFH